MVEDLAGAALGRESLNRIKALDLAALPMVEGAPRLGPPVGLVPKFLGIGLNYRDHAEETGMPIPEVPIVFAKASSCVSGPYDPVLAPKGFERMDYEVELAVVIGTRAKNVTEAGALDYVAGYCIGNDISERSLQKGGPGEWIKAKSYDTFGPLGPWLVTTDEVPDPQQPRSYARPQRDPHADRLDLDHDLQRGRAGELYQPIHDADARRRHHHRHPARRRHGAQPSRVPEAGR